MMQAYTKYGVPFSPLVWQLCLPLFSNPTNFLDACLSLSRSWYLNNGNCHWIDNIYFTLVLIKIVIFNEMRDWSKFMSWPWQQQIQAVAAPISNSLSVRQVCPLARFSKIMFKTSLLNSWEIYENDLNIIIWKTAWIWIIGLDRIWLEFDNLQAHHNYNAKINL